MLRIPSNYHPFDLIDVDRPARRTAQFQRQGITMEISPLSERLSNVLGIVQVLKRSALCQRRILILQIQQACNDMEGPVDQSLPAPQFWPQAVQKSLIRRCQDQLTAMFNTVAH